MSNVTSAPAESLVATCLPANMPDREMLAAQYQEELEKLHSVFAAENIARAIGGVVESHLVSYDHNRTSSLEAALKLGQGTCLTFTGLAIGIANAVEGVDIVPAINTTRTRDDKTKEIIIKQHASFFVVRDSLLYARANRGTQGPYEYDPTVAFMYDKYAGFDLFDVASAGNTPVLQARHYPGEHGPVILRNNQTNSPHPTNVPYKTMTFFMGEEGNASYLQTAEYLSADYQGRDPETYPTGGVIVPQL